MNLKFIYFNIHEIKCSNQHFPGQWSKIWNCANGDCGRDIYRNMARKIRELHPFPSYMPWITINNVYDEYMQTQAENDLVNFICSKAVSNRYAKILFK